MLFFSQFRGPAPTQGARAKLEGHIVTLGLGLDGCLPMQLRHPNIKYVVGGKSAQHAHNVQSARMFQGKIRELQGKLGLF